MHWLVSIHHKGHQLFTLLLSGQNVIRWTSSTTTSEFWKEYNWNKLSSDSYINCRAQQGAIHSEILTSQCITYRTQILHFETIIKVIGSSVVKLWVLELSTVINIVYGHIHIYVSWMLATRSLVGIKAMQKHRIASLWQLRISPSILCYFLHFG